MDVSVWPLLITVGSMAFVVFGIVNGIRNRQSKVAFRYVLLGVSGIGVPPLGVLLVGYLLWIGVMCGLSQWQLTYARWLESAPEIASEVSLIPFDFRFDESWYWLEIAAQNGNREALYAIGNRLKHEMFVPIAQNEGDRARGQSLINKATAAGFHPPCPEEQYYFGCFRIHLFGFK